MWLQCASRTVLGLVIGTVLLLTVVTITIEYNTQMIRYPRDNPELHTNTLKYPQKSIVIIIAQHCS